MEVREFFVQKPLPVFGKSAKLSLTVLLREEKPSTKPSPAVRTSVVIPAHNEERYLGRTLASLQRQNYGWFETIVVANGCTDRTVEVARGRCDRLVELSEKSLGIARNLGARLAKGSCWFFWMPIRHWTRLHCAESPKSLTETTLPARCADALTALKPSTG